MYALYSLFDLLIKTCIMLFKISKNTVIICLYYYKSKLLVKFVLPQQYDRIEQLIVQHLPVYEFINIQFTQKMLL